MQQIFSMSVPLFYTETDEPTDIIMLDEAASRHINQVLRMKKGEALLLTNGKGKKISAAIQDQGKKTCTVAVENITHITKQEPSVTIAISLIKNTGRFEWFLEKVTEMGVTCIVPLICERTEKTHFRPDRMKNILVSAMIQSQQYWLPALPDPVQFKQWVSQAAADKKWIAHCMDANKQKMQAPSGSSLICIGPEGDFTASEVEMALENGFEPVTLGDNRLRTETAGMVAAALLRLG